MTKFLGALVVLLTVLKASADNVTLYVLPPLRPIDWTSPRTMAWSVLKGEIKARQGGSHQVGHGMIELYCEAQGEDKPVNLLTAITTDDGVDEKPLLLKQKVGLGLFFTPEAGRLETPPEIADTLAEHLESGRVRFIQFQINHANCMRTARYYKEFVERGYDRHYGYPGRPRYGQGAGCTPYAYSYLEVAGVMTKEMRDAWNRRFYFPISLVGAPVTNNKVSILKLLADFHPSWIRGDGEYATVDIQDAGWSHAWIGDVWNNHGKSKTDHFKPVMEKKAMGLYIDRSDAPEERGPIWLTDHN